MELITNSKKRYINYKTPIFLSKSYPCKLFFSNQLYWFGSEKNLSCSIQSLLKLLVIEIDLDITQHREEHYKSNIYTNVGQ